MEVLVRIKKTHMIGILEEVCEGKVVDGLAVVKHKPDIVASGPLVHDIKDLELISPKEFKKELRKFKNFIWHKRSF